MASHSKAWQNGETDTDTETDTEVDTDTELLRNPKKRENISPPYPPSKRAARQTQGQRSLRAQKDGPPDRSGEPPKNS